MAAQSEGDSYRSNRKLTPEQRAKVRRRTTRSSKKRLRDRYLGNDRPDAPSGTGGAPAPDAQAPRPPYGSLSPWGQAVADSNVRYGPVLGEIRQDQANVTPWFDQYRQQVQGASSTYGQQSAPIVSQAQQAQQNVGQAAPGTEADPDAQLAAQSRSALMGLGVTALQGIVNANQGYFAGRAGPVAAAGELGMKKDLGREERDTLGERQQYRVTRRGELRSQAHTQRLENAAFGLDSYEAETERKDKARDDRQSAAGDRADRRAKNREVITSGPFAGYTKGEVRRMSPAEKDKLRKANDKSGGGGNDFTPKQRSETKIQIRKGIEKVVGRLRGKSTAPASYWSQAYSALVNELDYDPVVARAVIQIVRDGKAKPGTAKTIGRDYGVFKLPKRKPFTLPDPYVLPDRPETQPGDRPLTSP